MNGELLIHCVTTTLANGVGIVAVAQFNEGKGCITVDDNQWVVVIDGKPSFHIPKEAMSLLKQLPNSPKDYPPYYRFTNPGLGAT